MKKKVSLFLTIFLICLCLTGCKNKHDTVEMYYRNDWIFDNITIKIKDGYFYDNHEKFTVDENTIGLTIYFSKSNDAEESWD